MKRWVKTSIGIIIFLLIITGITVALSPVYRWVTNMLQSYEELALNILEEKTGMSVSYKSLSPSLLTGVNIKGIEFFDAESGVRILTIRKVIINYNLKELLHRNYDKIFSKLTIVDVTFEFDKEKYSGILKKLENLLESSDTKTTEIEENKAGKSIDEKSKSILSEEALSSIENMIFLVPFDVQIKNIKAHYVDDMFDATAALNSININKQRNINSITVNSSGYAIAAIKDLSNQTAGAVFNIEAKLLQGMSGSSVILSLDKYNKADYSVNSMELLARYSDRNVVVRSTQKVYPYDLFASLNLDSGDVHAELETKSLNPLQLVKIPPLQAPLNMFIGTRLTVDGEFDFNIFTQNYLWDANGSVYLPSTVLPGGETVAYDLRGNKNDIIIHRLRASGSTIGATLSGAFNIPKLQPSGTLFIDHVRLPNGNNVSGDIYIDPLDNGIQVFIPQLFFNEEAAFTALQLGVFPENNFKSISFAFDMSDYSHSETGDIGNINLEGSVALSDNPEIQAYILIDRLFLDSVASSAAFVLDDELKQTVTSLLPTLEPYVMSTEIYFSTDLKSITFNSPSLILADTSAPARVLALSVDGTEQAVHVNSLHLSYDGQDVQAVADADISLADNQVLFTTDCSVNSIPYQLNGIYSFGEWLNITGNYGLDVTVNFDDIIHGTAQLSNFPVAFSDFLFSISLNTAFSYSEQNGIVVDIPHLELEEISGKISIDPRIAISGRVDNAGFVIDSLSYTDISSQLQGSGYALWNINGGIFDSLNLDLDVSSQLSTERIHLQGNLTNPLGAPLDSEHIMSDFYFSAQADIVSFPLDRFLKDQHADDTLTASISANGTIENPYVTVDISSFSMELAGYPVIAHGNLAFVEGNLTIPSFDAHWNGADITDLSATFDVANFSGLMTANATYKTGDMSFNLPLYIAIFNDSTDETASLLPEDFTVILDSEGLQGSMIQKAIPLHFELNRSPGMIFISSDSSLGLSGAVTDTGHIMFSIDNSKPFHFTASGNIQDSIMDISLSNLYVDIPEFAYLFNSEMFSIYRGVLSGQINLSGYVSDPEIDGSLRLANLDFNSPSYIPDHILANSISVNMRGNEIQVPETFFIVKDGVLSASANVTLDRWSPEIVEASVSSRNTKGIPLDINVPLVKMKGRTAIDASLVYTSNQLMVTGGITLSEAEVSVAEDLTNLSFSSLTGKSGTQVSPMDMLVDMELNVE